MLVWCLQEKTAKTCHKKNANEMLHFDCEQVSLCSGTGYGDVLSVLQGMHAAQNYHCIISFKELDITIP